MRTARLFLLAYFCLLICTSVSAKERDNTTRRALYLKRTAFYSFDAKILNPYDFSYEGNANTAFLGVFNSLCFDIPVHRALSLQLEYDMKGYTEQPYGGSQNLGFTGYFTPTLGVNVACHFFDIVKESPLNKYVDFYSGVGIGGGLFFVHWPDNALTGHQLKWFAGVNARLLKHLYLGVEYDIRSLKFPEKIVTESGPGWEETTTTYGHNIFARGFHFALGVYF